MSGSLRVHGGPVPLAGADRVVAGGGGGRRAGVPEQRVLQVERHRAGDRGALHAQGDGHVVALPAGAAEADQGVSSASVTGARVDGSTRYTPLSPANNVADASVSTRQS